jgi:16S rRNA (guanine527-N7)-methyltransferase
MRLLDDQASLWGLELTKQRIDRLVRYAHLLSDYTEANVVGEHDEAALVLNHVLDSLSCFLALETTVESLVDVGSGGGLPGIPLAIIMPETRFTLLEATGKKTRFLGLAVQELGLDNVAVVNGRAEEVGQGEHRGRYQVATSRAVASLAVVAEYCVPLLRVGGLAVAMKGKLSADELGAGEVAVETLGAVLRPVLPVPQIRELPDRERNLVLIEKVEETLGGYPRRPGLARKRPLGGL